MALNDLPAYSYVPGLWPHPHSSLGHQFAIPDVPTQLSDLPADAAFRLACRLFDAGYYWEAHEAWERLWHAAGRRGDLAGFLKGLIQLAVVGVKIREGRGDSARSHAERAVELFDACGQPTLAGIEVARFADVARRLLDALPPTPANPRKPVEILFSWSLERLLESPPGRE